MMKDKRAMPVETERKFLVKGTQWRSAARRATLKQGYISNDARVAVRIRIADDQAFLTIKGAKSGISRLEYEYSIPVADAEELLASLCLKPIIEKVRYTLDYSGLEWIVDEFAGENAGLIVAEVELEREDQPIDMPEWVGEEVTDDPRYLNANLVKAPYRMWAAP